ncbi:hypothetical protein U9M48_042652 [Paspalum notatum var. saurae]|uniref:Reverse transcriptase Ty1/copia-type domain-containing protein n=1 Tax=Paspalum notatum var. saurae TaxID=547442 RepID=A0AAQ3XGD3_PASNO
MHEELNNFIWNVVWELVERPKDYNVIGTKWVFRNKQDENGIMVRNKAILVAQLKIGTIHILLAFACAHNIKLFQMDVKSAFLNGKISGLVYVEQPLGFDDPKKPNHVYKLSKAFYGLKQAPRAWYERLRDFPVSKGFKFGKVDTTLFTKSTGVEMFMIGELSLFLGLQIKQMKDEISVSQSKYLKDMLKKFGLEDAKPIKTPMETNGHLDLDDGGK